MRIKLVDIDSKIPNLALMQLSAYFKQNLDNQVGFDIENPDVVYISCIFSWNAGQAKGIASMYPNAEVYVGGTGIDLDFKIPIEAQKIKPDYDLYPSEYSLGFTTRGCIRKCPFCVVPKKEGKLKRWQHVSEFHDDRFKSIICLDNNITANKEWFFENTNWIIERKLRFNAIQGMDIRLLTPEIAEQIKALKWEGQIHFAWDDMNEEEVVRAGISILQDAGIRTRSDVNIYVLCGYNTTIEEDIYRCQVLKSLDVGAYAMPYIQTPEINALRRWSSRKHLYWGHDFKDYDRLPRSLLYLRNQNNKSILEG